MGCINLHGLQCMGGHYGFQPRDHTLTWARTKLGTLPLGARPGQLQRRLEAEGPGETRKQRLLAPPIIQTKTNAVHVAPLFLASLAPLFLASRCPLGIFLDLRNQRQTGLTNPKKEIVRPKRSWQDRSNRI